MTPSRVARGEPVSDDAVTPSSRSRSRPDTELSLLLDVGTAWTKASVVGRAGGRWRIVTGAAQPTAWGEAALIEDLAARLAVHADPRLGRRLALLVRDAPRITCRSPRDAGRLVIAAGSAAEREAAHRSAMRAGWDVVAAVSVDDRRTDAERFNLLRDLEPHAWLAVASNAGDGQALWGTLAGARHGSTSPLLVVGSTEMRDALGVTFGTDPRWLGAQADVDLFEALLALLAEVRGFGEPRGMAPVAFARSTEALARGLGLAVLGVDVGATWTAWGYHAPADGANAILAAAALRSPSAAHALAVEVLPVDLDEHAAADAIANQEARPSALPAAPAEIAIAQARVVDRMAAARGLMGDLPSLDLIVGGGRVLAGAAHPADAAIMLLDGLRPPGVVQLALDPWGICGPLGSLPGDDVDEGLETLRDDLLVPLGTAVASRGGRPGHLAFRARLRRPGWPDTGWVDVRVGSLAALPLERGARGELDVDVERSVEIGASPRGRRIRVEVTGGAVGVILDAREDPIQLPARPADARAVVTSWRETLRRESRPAAG